MFNFKLCVLTTIKKINKDMEDLKNTINQLNLTFIENNERLKNTHSFQEHMKHFSEQTIIGQQNRTQILNIKMIQSMLSDNNRIKMETTIERVPGKPKIFQN